MENKTIVLTGGGTAGHVSPNINLQPELKKHFDKIVYIGSEHGIEKELINKRTDYIYKSIPTVKFIRKNIIKNVFLPIKLLNSISKAKKILKQENPSIVFSKGGYVGLPVVIAARKLNIPVICHESDITIGLANKLAKKYANIICTNFEKTAQDNGKKCIYTGMPLNLSKLTKKEAKQKLNITTNKPILLITGGSLGAKAINEFIFNNIEKLTKNYYLIHIVGKGNLNDKIKNSSYEQLEFSNDMWTIFRATDIAISRAGANTIVELMANEIPTIFVPLPKGLSRGDQVDNAKYMSNLGVSKTIFQEDLSIEKVQNLLKSIEKDMLKIKNTIKKQNFQDGTQKIIKLILDQKKH